MSGLGTQAGMMRGAGAAGVVIVFEDDFSTDTSANYYNYKYDTGAEYDPVKFDINDSDNGILQLDTGVSANAIVHKTATLDIGESYKIDFLAASNVRGQIISNTNDGTSTTGNGYVVRLRYNANGTLNGVSYGQGFSGTDTLGGSASIATSGTTVWMEREEAKKFNIYHNASGSQVLMGAITLNADPGTLYVGVQTHNASASYDNLQITY